MTKGDSHSWMFGQRSAIQKPAPKPETIREWYDRTTRQWRKALIWATAVSALGGVVFYAFTTFSLAARLQTVNGAYTIPIAAFIWILAFVYIFLVPNREVGFRSQEAIEKTVELLQSAIEEKLSPAIVLWKRIGDRVEQELPRFIEEARETFASAKRAIEKLEKAADQNGQIHEEAKPVIEALRRIEEKIEREGVIDEVREAARAVKAFVATPAPQVRSPLGRPGELPRVDAALDALGRKDGLRR